MQWWFKKFCKGVESLEYEEPRGWPSEADNKLRRSSKLIRLQLHKKSPKNSVSTILQLFATWSKLETWKSLIIGCLISWPKIKKKSFWSVIFSYSMQQQQNHFSIRLWHATKSVFYNDNWWQPAQWLDQEETPKHFPKPNLHPKKVKVTVWYSAACLIDNSFLNPGETTTSGKYAE